MTTDLRIGSLAACALAAIVLWFASVATITVAVEPTRSVVVFGGSAATVTDAVAGANVSLLGGSGRMLTVIGAAPGFVRELYARGAWLVLPATSGGCRGAQSVPRRG